MAVGNRNRVSRVDKLFSAYKAGNKRDFAEQWKNINRKTMRELCKRTLVCPKYSGSLQRHSIPDSTVLHQVLLRHFERMTPVIARRLDGDDSFAAAPALVDDMVADAVAAAADVVEPASPVAAYADAAAADAAAADAAAADAVQISDEMMMD
jgi:hypothetical protein